MKPLARQSLLTTISSYIGVLIGYFNVLWLLPYVLQPDEIGLFRTLQDMALLIVPIAQLGIGNGITRFFPLVKEKMYAFFTLSLGLTLVGFLIVSVLFLIFKDYVIAAFATNSPEVIDFLGVVLFITFFSVMNTILEAFCRSFMKIAVPTFFREVVNRLFTATLIGLYFMGWLSFDQMIWGLAVLYLTTVIGMLIYMLRINIFELDFDFSSFPKGFRSEFIKYSLITLLGTAGSVLIMKIDSLMVSSMIGLDANAIYTIAFSIAIVIELPRRAISQVAMPVVAEHFAKNELREINKLYKDVAVHQFLFCLLLFLGIWSNIDNLYHFVPNNVIYETGKWVVLWIGLAKMADILFSINGEIIVFSKYYVFNITATLIMCVAVIVLNLLLIPMYGIEGAAVASFLSLLIYNLIKYFYLKIRLDFDPFSLDILKILVLGSMTYIIQFFLLQNMEVGFNDIILRSLLITVTYITGMYLLGIAKESQKSIIEKIKRPRP
ncbi:oligosaccharide flippase family protein [Aquiflexum lacus]|uniref:oligosaccharide flippase family protein n=1 Tax=Aquiflexum lacus TaxID=2483805 RepID=UPI0018952E1C|nr:polysaccharide biosynthesis C-terminal domain-containing protein [Aquiflexum lacus]